MKLGSNRGILVTLVAILILSFLSVEDLQAQTKTPTDKAAHFGMAAAAQTSCAAIGRLVSGDRWLPGITCFLLINTVGVAKEATDPYRGGQRDVNDIYANLAGSGLSFITISLTF